MNVLPVNESEAVLEAFWNGDKNADGIRLDVLAPYRVTWPSGASGSLRPPAYFTLVKPASAGPSLVLERDGDLRLSGYDRFVLSAALPASVKVSLLARLDGTWQPVFRDLAGTDSYAEYEGGFSGNHLSGLRFEFTLVGPGPAAVTLAWLMAANSAGVARMLGGQPVFDSAWPGLLEPDPGAAEPQLGLFFDAGQLTALRAKVRLPHLRPHYEALLARARELLAIRPEELVGVYAPGGDIVRGCRKRDSGKPWLGAGVADLLAFAGIMEDNAQFSRQAARMALALAHCGHWVHSFMGALPGTTGHPRCFSESYILRPLPLVLDWAGHCLTPAGRELVRDAMIMKGLARVESDFRRWEYIRGMNQGLLFTPGRVQAYLALEKTYPRYSANLLEAERDMKAMLNHYLQPDGGTLEGMGYWHSVGEIFPTLYALARRHGKPFRNAMGERIRRTADYAQAMFSTAGDGDTFLTINAAGQGHNKPSLMMAAVFAGTAESAPWRHIYARLAAEAKPEADWFHLVVAPTAAQPSALGASPNLVGRPLADRLLCARHAASGGPTAEPMRPAACYCFPRTGHAGIHRSIKGLGVIRFHLFSGPSRGGHSHQDKGSFILEAAGEQLALDRGTTGYDNPAHLLMGKAAWHNLVVPEDADGKALEQQPLTTPGGRIESATFADGLFDAVCDNRRAWAPGLFSRNRRRIWSPAPDLFVIDDDLRLQTPHGVSFRLNSAFPMAREADGSWIVAGDRSQLRVTPVNWTPGIAESRVEGIDCHGHLVHLLRLATAASREHRLLTLLEILPVGAKEPNWRWRWAAEKQVLELEPERRPAFRRASACGSPSLTKARRKRRPYGEASKSTATFRYSPKGI